MTEAMKFLEWLYLFDFSLSLKRERKLEVLECLEQNKQ